MHSWFQKRLEIEEMNQRSQSLALKFLGLNATQSAQALLVQTFLVLYLLDILTFQELGMLFAIQFGLILLLDYPTGALADAVGHKNVLVLAYVSYIGAILFLLAADSFLGFIPWVILAAIGASQESGALPAWFDNNYRVTSDDLDKDRRMYGAFLGKVQVVGRIISATAFISGGLIAGILSRKILFILQLILVCVALAVIILLMHNEKGVEVPPRTLKAYVERLKGGLEFLASSHGVLLFFLGIAILAATFTSIWGAMMLFPFYASYSGSDEYTGLLRAILFLSGIIWLLYISKMTKEIQKPHRILFLSYVMLSIGLPTLVYGFYETIPPPNRFVLISYLAVIILLQWIGIWFPLQIILQRRIMIELVPDRYRNAVYSLIPTLFTLFGIPFVILAGYIITNHGFAAGLLLMIVLGSIGISVLGIGLYYLAKPETTDQVPLEQTPADLQKKSAPTSG
ncbi:MAG: MFS transporter [Candidatus Hodarchaeota archaeon]